MTVNIDTEVGRLAVYDQGSGAATFLWHSLYVDHASLDGLVAELGDRRCLRVDGPGHGASPGPGRRYQLADCVRAAFQVLDALGVSEVDWVGNAWGGHVGVAAALAAPSRIKSLAVIGSPMEALPKKMRVETRLLLAMLSVGLGGTAANLLANVMLSRSSPHRGFFCRARDGASSSPRSKNLLRVRPAGIPNGVRSHDNPRESSMRDPSRRHRATRTRWGSRGALRKLRRSWTEKLHPRARRHSRRARVMVGSV